MLLVFVDECGDQKFRDYLGLSIATINSSFYRTIKEEFQHILRARGWDEGVEFKGAYLFSASKGCPSIGIEERIEMAREILALNTAITNARMKFYYLRVQSRNQKVDYLRCLPSLLEKALPKATKGHGKDVVAISCDHRSDMSQKEIRDAVLPVIKDRGFTLQEDVLMSMSNFETVGILLADIVGYLTARIDTISNDSELFDSITPEALATSGKIKKLQSSMELIKKIKALNRYELKVAVR